MKQLVVSGNRILAHGEDCFLAMGGTVICTKTGKSYPNATVVNCEAELPADIGEVGYEYHAGAFVPCAPYGKGDGNLAVVCGEDCKAIKDSNMPLSGIINDEIRTRYCLDDDAKPVDLYNLVAQYVVPTILVEAPTGSTVTVTNGEKTITAEAIDGKCLFYVKEGLWDVHAKKGVNEMSMPITVDEVKQYTARLLFEKIWGAEWDGTESPEWTRTDLAANFVDPSPAVNNGTGSSPFDECYPWAGMQRSTDEYGNEVVSIPKFWYKWTRNGAKMKLQIADYPANGFYVSPAHSDRGDGSGERDIVYVGRYHCNASGKSVTNVMPGASAAVIAAQTKVQSNSSEHFLVDYQTYWTICMLYLVEYANWDSQRKIGYGCSSGGEKFLTGCTDEMRYHTGTDAVSRDTYGSTQYRYIEDLWGNVYDIIGNAAPSLYYTSLFCEKSPYRKGESLSGAATSRVSMSTGSDYIKSWSDNSDDEGMEFLIAPASVYESHGYVRDQFSALNVVNNSEWSRFSYLYFGGKAANTSGCGLFCLKGVTADYSNISVGYRLIRLPGYGA